MIGITEENKNISNVTKDTIRDMKYEVNLVFFTIRSYLNSNITYFLINSSSTSRLTSQANESKK